MSKRLPIPRLQAVGLDGRPLAGAKLYTYTTGTTTPKATYSDAGLSVANANPVIADSAGRFGQIFVGPGDYKVVLEDAAGTVVSTDDPVEGSSSVSGTTLGSALTLAYTNPVLTVNKAASGQANTIEGATNSVTRWRIIPGNNTAETGTNAGSNLDIEAYNDAGSFLSRPVRITRATGAVELAGNVNIAKEAPEYRATDGSTSASAGFNVDATVAAEIFIGSFSSTAVNFGTNNATRVRMDTAGNVNFIVGATIASQTVGVWNRSAVTVTTSGTTVDVNIPASFTARRATVLFDLVSTNGTSPIMVQLAAGGSVEATSYVVGGTYIGGTNYTGHTAYTTGFVFGSSAGMAAASLYSGRLHIDLSDGSANVWIGAGQIASDTAGQYTLTTSGRKALSATLDRIRLTTVGGTDTFDNGSMTVVWE